MVPLRENNATDKSEKEVLFNIEKITWDFLHHLLRGEIYDIRIHHTSQEVLSKLTGDYVWCANENESVINCWKRLKSYTRLWIIMEVIHASLKSGSRLTIRGIYYMLKPHPMFLGLDYSCIPEYINIISSMLLCKRRNLGIIASPKGLVCGPLCVYSSISTISNREQQEIVFNGNKNEILVSDDLIQCLYDGTYILDISQANYILVVEKESIYHILKESYDILCCLRAILVCARGMPDINTRIFLHKLSLVKDNSTPILGIFDYNPGGARIFFTYRGGSKGLINEAFQYGIII
eukprot:TRINITY_DN2180_c0_g1_i2.p1 TRINITY_DN2180_c0_g1~~TRINITY_DN2180_c0_g1_i2.p1  ORF type:complete len:293 (-),score=23.48 TRINITY_DN2180_c0_g1_i2:417-1295(-)